MSKINNKFIYIMLVIMSLSPIFSGCSKEEANALQQTPPPPTVTVSNPLKKGIVELADYTGTTEAYESVVVRARVEGELEKIYFTPGEKINKGDLLYTIDPKPYKARLDEAIAQLNIHEAELKFAKATKKRRENAFKAKAVSEVEVIEASATLSTAMAAVTAAKAAIKRAELDLSYTKIKAPISGTIGRSLVDAGNLVGAGVRTELTTIVNDEKIYAYFPISERDLLHYKNLNSGKSPASGNTPVFLGLAGGTDYPFNGKIDYLHNRVNQLTGTISVRAVFENIDGILMPGLFARVQIPVGIKKDALLVPNTALGKDQQGDFLLIADNENKVRYQSVKIGILENGMREIRDGINENDRVIINGLQKAYPGTIVTPVDKNVSAENNEDSKENRS
jgi:RND family efflux transporter MFP subunit